MDYEYLEHSGVAHDENPPGRGSGRYGWGTGENPYQHQFNLKAEVSKLKAQGLKDGEIAKILLGEKATSTSLKAQLAIETKRQWMKNREKALELYDKYGNKSEVARQMGINESQVRNLLDDTLVYRASKYENTAELIKKRVDEYKYVDVGKDTEKYLGVTENTKMVALEMLKEEGYKIAYVRAPQASGGDNKTTIMVLVAPDADYSKAFDLSAQNIYSIQDFSPDGGQTWWVPQYPEAIDSSRIYIRYKDDPLGGSLKDGVIELRKGVEDISLGDVNYAQVRINVDDKAYMKGMAIYSDDIPDGYDVVYNTNKKEGTKLFAENENDSSVFKPLKTNKETGEVDRDNPFGAAIKAGGQREYTDQNGNTKLSVINKIQEEGDWDKWSRTISSQFLSKQSLKLINQQLDLTVKDKKAQLEEIKELTNPVIKQKLLDNFAGMCDSNASSLSSVGFKNQAYQVILPVSKLSDKEIFAPNYQDGDMVALVRYPHAGTFEIPVLKVNNQSDAGITVVGNSKDAVGINPKVAEILSGADFDGDFVVVIPLTSNNLKVSTQEPIKELITWDNKEGYRLPSSAPAVTNSVKQREMGIVTNLINDMSVQGATTDEIVRAAKHSMVVIDSEKHHLDYKQSYIDQDIQSLKEKYQKNPETGSVGGASTILSRAMSEAHVPERREVTNTKIMTDEELAKWKNGEIVYRETGNTKLKLITDTSKMTAEELQRHKSGRKVWRQSDELVTQKVTKMSTVSDAMDLVRDKNDPKEVAYANFANDMKSLANEARKISRSIEPIKVNQQAKQTYSAEVESLRAKVENAQLNNPKERLATTIMNAAVSVKLKSNPDMDYEHQQRLKALEMNKARAQVGAKKEKVDITEKEWEAIQAGAVNTTLLKEVVNNADQTTLTKLATPKGTGKLSDAKISLAKSMKASGMYTNQDIAERIGVSASYVSKIT